MHAMPPRLTDRFDTLARAGSAVPGAEPVPCLESGQLLGAGREVLIRHGDAVYRLRHTRNGKLILTK